MTEQELQQLRNDGLEHIADYITDLEDENKNLIGWKNGINPKPLKVFVRWGEEINQVKKLATVDLQALEVLALRSQAKGIEDYVNNRALILKDSSWFADDPPSIEYLYKAGFGLGESQQALQYADNLKLQADKLERGE